jgi:hypothetical protein
MSTKSMLDTHNIISKEPGSTYFRLDIKSLVDGEWGAGPENMKTWHKVIEAQDWSFLRTLGDKAIATCRFQFKWIL